MNRPNIIEQGTSIAFGWPDLGIAAEVAAIREERGDIKAEVTFMAEATYAAALTPG
jgi:hypothetical protein